MRAVHVLFYIPMASDQWLNHFVTRVDPPFSHCDIQFDDGFASSVYNGESVYWEKKTFSRTQYTRISLAFDDHEYSKVLKFCQDAHQRQWKFDLLGMICSKLLVPVRRPGDRTFCSRYILEALQASGRPEFQVPDPVLTSPSGLHSLLVENGKGFLHVSERRMQLGLNNIQ